MFRHLFMAEFKDDISEEIRQQEIADLRAMKDKIPYIKDLKANRTTGWIGAKDLIMMTVDVDSKEDFDAFQAHPYHADYIAGTGQKYCKPDSFVVGQIEI